MLFGTKTFNRVHHGGFEGLVTDSEQGDHYDARAGGGEDPPGQGGVIVIAFQPFAHAEIREGNGDEDGYDR